MCVCERVCERSCVHMCALERERERERKREELAFLEFFVTLHKSRQWCPTAKKVRGLSEREKKKRTDLKKE